MDDVVVLVVVGIIFNGLSVMIVHSGLKDLDCGIKTMVVCTNLCTTYINWGIRFWVFLFAFFFSSKKNSRLRC